MIAAGFFQVVLHFSEQFPTLPPLRGSTEIAPETEKKQTDRQKIKTTKKNDKNLGAAGHELQRVKADSAPISQAPAAGTIYKKGAVLFGFHFLKSRHNNQPQIHQA